MELPHAHPYGSTEGRKSTHDFLSLYSPVQQDSRSSQGGFFKTHDFLQPLELMTEEEKKVEAVVETSRLPATPLTTCSSLEHNIPGGIGSYSMSHISYLNQRVPNSEGVLLNNQASSSDRNDDNSNGSSYTLWDESVVMNKGQTWKENNCAAKERHCVREAKRVHTGGNRQSFMKKQSFMDMIKSAKSGQENEDEDDVEFVIKKEPSPHHKGNMSIKMDEKGTDQKPNTPRSKHSATEQRRRSKINDRFQMLRGLIPHTDQKRDKASFLLEVIEYIQFLQEKVHKYEDPYERWSQEPPKMMPWQNGHRTNEAFGDQSGGTNCGSGSTLVFAAKIDEAITNVSSTMPQGGHGLLESEISTADTTREMDCQRGLTNDGLLLPSPLQQTTHKRSTSAAVPLPPRVTSNTEIRTSQPNPQLCQSRPCTTDSTNFSEKLKDQDLTIESGTISISTVYSQGLLNALTQSLHSSGVDLSQASISVQIDIGNRANSPIPIVQTDDLPSNNQTMLRSRLHSGGGESEQAFKRLKTASS